MSQTGKKSRVPRYLVGGVIVLLMITSMAEQAAPALGQQEEGESQRRAFVEAERLIRLSMELPVEPEQVFDAWTNAPQLVEWFPHWAEITVTEGGSYRMGWDGIEAVWEGTYMEVERPAVLVFTWNPPAEYFPHGAYPTTVRLTFEQVDDVTEMVLEHSGFRGTPEMETTLETWRAYLYNLRAMLLQSTPGGQD
jgi:uncharacterized protein YndB with AHSA1/START domain